MFRVLVLATLLAVPLTAAGPTDGAEHCASLDRQLDQTYPTTWYEFCGRLATADADARAYYTQTVVGCTNEGRSCTYAPVFHAALDTLAPGDWIVRASSRIHTYPAGANVPGSQRAAECVVSGLGGGCDAPVANVQITSTNFVAYRWSGEWRVYYRDPTGVEHFQASGTGSGWLAQYY